MSSIIALEYERHDKNHRASGKTKCMYKPYVHTFITDYGRPVRKSPSLHGRKSTPTTKFLGTAKAYFVSPNFQISLIYAFIGCP